MHLIPVNAAIGAFNGSAEACARFLREAMTKIDIDSISMSS